MVKCTHYQRNLCSGYRLPLRFHAGKINKFTLKVLLDTEDLDSAVNELAGEILQKHPAFEKIAIVGIQQGGVVLADELVKALRIRLNDQDLPYGQLDITFYRDDLHACATLPPRVVGRSDASESLLRVGSRSGKPCEPGG